MSFTSDQDHVFQFMGEGGQRSGWQWNISPSTYEVVAAVVVAGTIRKELSEIDRTMDTKDASYEVLNEKYKHKAFFCMETGVAARCDEIFTM